LDPSVAKVNVVCPETLVYKVNVDPKDLLELREMPEMLVTLDVMEPKDLKDLLEPLELLVSPEKPDPWEAPVLMVNQVLLADPENKVSLVMQDQSVGPAPWVFPDLLDMLDLPEVTDNAERKEILDHPDPLVWPVPVVPLDPLELLALMDPVDLTV